MALNFDCVVQAGDLGDPRLASRVTKLLTHDDIGKYAMPINGTAERDTSSSYRLVSPKTQKPIAKLTTAIPGFPTIKSPYEILEFAARAYGSKPFIGERLPVKIKDAEGEWVVTSLTDFKYFTYADALRQVQSVGRALDMRVKVPVTEVHDGKFVELLKIVGVWSRTRLDWRIVDFALSYRKMVNVPLYDTFGTESIRHILKLTDMRVIVVEGSKIDAALEFVREGIPLEAIITMDRPSLKQIAAYAEMGVELFYLKQLRREFHEIADDLSPVSLVPSLDSVTTIIFTSGTTGNPKGAVHTNRSFLTMLGGYLSSGNRMTIQSTDVLFSFLPLAHIYQRGVELMVTLMGLQIGYYSGDMAKIAEDLQMLRPTVFIGVPRVLTKMLFRIRDGISERNSFLQWIVSKALQMKRYKYNTSFDVRSTIPDMLFSKIRGLFGGRMRIVATGSAPMEADHITELQMYLSAPICEGWGMTETGIIFLQHCKDIHKGSLGGPLSCAEFRVQSLPEFKYNAKGNPPRGELLVRGDFLMRGYFKEPEKTADSFTLGGWFRTGDVVEVLPSGAVKIIDRAKNIFKLSQGEYVAPERLENIFGASPWVDQIFVYGESLKPSLVAVIVPNASAVKEWATVNNVYDSSDGILENSDLRETILTDLETLGRSQNLKGFEIIRAVHLTNTPFSVDNGLLTPTLKLVRPVASRVFLPNLESLYAELKDASTF